MKNKQHRYQPYSYDLIISLLLSTSISDVIKDFTIDIILFFLNTGLILKITLFHSCRLMSPKGLVTWVLRYISCTLWSSSSVRTNGGYIEPS